MASSAPPTLRVPLILLALANLVVLGLRLWPWQEVMNMPGGGAVGIDPAVSLLGYVAVIIWLAGASKEPMKTAMGTGTMLGILGGAFLVAQTLLSAQAAIADGTQPAQWIKAFYVAAVLACGFAGLQGARATGTAGTGLLVGGWSAMVTALIASAAILFQMYLAGPPPASTDPWKQYQGLAIGDPAMQALVQSLNSVTFFLLVGPLVGALAGLIFGIFAPAKKR